MKKVGIIMGSDSDLPVVQKAADTLRAFGVSCEMHIYSAHRTPEQARDFSLNARAEGYGAIIAAAGMAAHLAGAIAARTTLPVIGIPCKSSNLDGLDALLSTVQMPSGVPVATVAIDGAENLKKLIDLHTIGILPCGSVRAHNLQELHEKTGADWAHTSAFEPCFDNSSDHDSILFTPTKPAQQGEYPKANGEIVKNVVDIARKI